MVCENYIGVQRGLKLTRSMTVMCCIELVQCSLLKEILFIILLVGNIINGVSYTSSDVFFTLLGL